MPDDTLAPALLLAMPDLADPNFRRSVVLIVHHDEEGAAGLVINRPADLRAADLCRTLDVRWRGAHDQIVYWGGPVQPQTGWVVCGDGLLEGMEEATAVVPGLHFAGSLDALQLVAEQPAGDLRLFLGYAGWGPGQLETELAHGAWVIAPFDAEALFGVEADVLWNHVWSTLGVDPATVVSTPGIH